MKIVRLGRKEFKEKYPGKGAMVERPRGKEPIIYIPGRASTHEILHEIYHAKESPDLEKIEKGAKWQTPDWRN